MASPTRASAALSGAAALAGSVALLLADGWAVLGDGPGLVAARATGAVATLAALLWQLRYVRQSSERRSALWSLWPEVLLLTGASVALAVEPEIAALLAAVYLGIAAWRAVRGTTNAMRLREWIQQSPAKLLALSFASLILVGALFLTFPRATTDGAGAGPVDALFTSTSATCVTGLAVLNTVDDEHAAPDRQTFTRFGQAIILLLIQLGGLGIMTLSAAALVFTGRRLRLRSAAVLQSLLDEDSAAALRRTFRDILRITLLVEAIGAVILTARFAALDFPLGEALWRGTFHSISAYCNAGFSLFGDSLASFSGDWILNLTHGGLIVFGGLGWVATGVVLSRRTWAGGVAAGWRRMALQVRMVVVLSAWLLVIGTILFFFFEYDHSLAGLPVGDKLLASFFQSISLRTAGFNSVDMSAMSREMVILACLFMFVGASPGSTGGGIKTTTFGVLLMSVRASVLGRRRVEAWHRTIPREVVTRASAIVTVAASTLVLGLIALLATQPDIPFDHLVFETFSALGTVGLSMGATPELDTAGRLIVIVLMFIGRLGPLTVALLVGEGRRDPTFQYPEARVAVG